MTGKYRVFLTMLPLMSDFVLIPICGVIAQQNPDSGKKSPPTAEEKTTEEKATDIKPSESQQSAPVIVNGKTFFTVHGGTASNPAAQRAEDIARRISRLEQKTLLQLQTLTIHENDGWTDIVFDGETIASLSKADATAAGRTERGLAEDVIEQIRTIVVSRQKADWRTIGSGILWTLLATVALIFAHHLLKRVLAYATTVLERWSGTRLRSVRLQELELLSEQRITGFLQLVLRISAVALTGVLIATYISSVLGYFPQTQGYASTLWGYLLAPFGVIGNAIISYIPNLFYIAIIVLVSYCVFRLIALAFAEIENGNLKVPGFHVEWTLPTFRIVRVLLIALTFVAVFPYLPGSRSPAFQGVSLFLGLLVSMSSSGAISNIVSGILLTYTRSFRIGDRVQIGNATGVVTETTMLVTRVRSDENVEIAIPNTSVLSTHVHNFNNQESERNLILKLRVTVDADQPWRKVEAMLLEAAERMSGLLPEPHPNVSLEAFADGCVTYKLAVSIADPNTASRTQSDLYKTFWTSSTIAILHLRRLITARYCPALLLSPPSDRLPCLQPPTDTTDNQETPQSQLHYRDRLRDWGVYRHKSSKSLNFAELKTSDNVSSCFL